MGKSVTPKDVVEMEGCTSMAWWERERYGIPGKGKPTNENLEKYVQAYISSLQPEGCNKHISKALGYMPVPNWARIRHNCAGGEVVAEWGYERKKITGPFEF